MLVSHAMLYYHDELGFCNIRYYIYFDIVMFHCLINIETVTSTMYYCVFDLPPPENENLSICSF